MEQYDHVDDVVQHAVGSADEVLDSLASAATAFADGVKGAGFEISNKSFILVASQPRLAKALARRLRAKGLQVCVASAGECLGVSINRAGRQNAASTRARFAKGKRRADRIRSLATVSRKAAKLFASGAKPQIVYGTKQYGTCSSAREDLDATAAKCVGGAGLCPCRTTLLFLRLGRLPSTTAIKEQLNWFIKAWGEADE